VEALPGTMSLIQGARYCSPVDHHVEELVEAEEDRGDGEGDAHDRERLVGGIALQPFAEAGRERRRARVEGCRG
jgi:hypothetical protein